MIRGRSTASVGYLETVAAAALWGSSGIWSTALFARGLTPGSTALLRPALGGIVLFAAALLVARPALRPGWRAFLILAGLGGAITAVFQIAYQSSLASSGVPTTVALLYLSPAFTLAASGPLLREWPTARQLGLAAFSVTGVWLTVTGVEGADVTLDLRGLGWGILAGATYAMYSLFGRWGGPRYGPWATLLHSNLGSCVLMALVLPVAGYPVVLPADGASWGILAAYSVLTLSAASILYYDALARIEAGRAAIFTTLEPVVAAVLATIFLNEGLTTRGWFGLAMVVAGVAGAYALERRSV